MPVRGLLIGCVLSFVGAAAAYAVDAPQPTGVVPRETPPAVLEDPIEPFLPLRPQSEAEARRVEAESLYTLGRLYELQGRLSDALRAYQRAARLDPGAVPILKQIIPLAFRLDRNHEAVRYALKVVELDPSDPRLLRQLGVHLTDRALEAPASRRESLLRRTIDLYEQARTQQAERGNAAGAMLLTLETGRLYYVLEQADQAADAFAEVLAALDDENVKLSDEQQSLFTGQEGAKTFGLFAESFLDAKRPELARRAFAKQQEQAPDEALADYQEARVLAEEGQAEAALERLQAFFDSRGEGRELRDEPYELLGRLLSDAGRSEQRIDRLQKIVEQRPTDHYAGYALAAALVEADRTDEAETLYRKLLEDRPAAEGYRALTRIYLESDRPDELLGLLAALVEQHNGIEALGDEADAIVATDGLVERLAAAARQTPADEATDANYGASAAVAMLALEAEEFDLASEFYERALTAKADAADELLSSWGMGLIMADRYTDAASVFQRAIDQGLASPDDPSLHYYLSAALEMADRTDEALVAAREAAKRADGSPQIQSRVGWVLFHARRYDEARAAYQQIVDQFADDYSSEQTRDALREIRLMLSTICVEQDQLEQAEEWLQQVLDEFPGDTSAYNDLGYLWADQNKNLEQARSMIEQAVADQPDNAAYRDSLGWVLYRLGRHDEAIVQLQQAAAASDDPDGVILDHLGDALHAAGRGDEAVEKWRQAVSAFERNGHQERYLNATRKKLAEHAGEPATPDGQ